MPERSSVRVVQLYSREKLEEFREMTLEARLRWLEEANAFVNSVLGFERRAQSDERFRDFPPQHQTVEGESAAVSGNRASGLYPDIKSCSGGIAEKAKT